MEQLPVELLEVMTRFLSSKETRALCSTSRKMNTRLQEIMKQKWTEFICRKYGERFMNLCGRKWVIKHYPNMTVCCEYLMDDKSLPFPNYAKHYIRKNWFKMNSNKLALPVPYRNRPDHNPIGPVWMGQVYRYYNAMQCHICNADAYTTSLAYGGANESKTICWNCAH